MSKPPLILVDAFPRSKEMIFTSETELQLRACAELVEHYGSRMPDALVEEHLDRVEIIVGQTPMDAARLHRAKNLKAIINVKGNWEPVIDYAEAQRLGVHVLSIAPVMAPAVAEMCIGFAICLGRGIIRNDRLFRSGEERYGIAGNGQAVSLYGASVGFVGYGNLGRALRPLLAPFDCSVQVYDPWLSPGYLGSQGCRAASLENVLSQSDYLFLLAGVHSQNEGFLTRAMLETIRKDACVVLASRAEIVEFQAFLDLAEAGHFRAAIDVFPEEPVLKNDPMRLRSSIVFSAHLAGGMRASYKRIAELLYDEIPMILQGFPPQRLQRAEPRLAAMQRSR
ncbi:SerA Phosphoglycerate dehydrogenase and related dehydrogenases [Rhabdaerophilaceae bacterium]